MDLAKKGVAYAQYEVGMLYSLGQGVPKDYILAYMWFNLAAAGGAPRAAPHRDSLERQMSKDQVARAQEMSRAWKPKAIRAEEEEKQRRAKLQPQVVRVEDLSFGQKAFETEQELKKRMLITLEFKCMRLGFRSTEIAEYNVKFQVNCTLRDVINPDSAGPYKWSCSGSAVGVCSAEPLDSADLDTILGKAPMATPADSTSLRATKAATGSTLIRSEIDAVARSGRYTPFPTAVQQPALGLGLDVLYVIENRTSYPLRVVFSGPADQEITVVPGAAQTITLPAGTYKVLGRVNAPNVLPFYVEQFYESGTKYTSQFFISTSGGR
jgi:hypothetical protein